LVLEVLGQDAAPEIDEILDLVETQLSSAEVFTALFELELAGASAFFRARITSGDSEFPTGKCGLRLAI
jgi:hypothetical protein